MAIFTHIRGLNMSRRFSRSTNAVVTTRAVAGNADVIKKRRPPAYRRVTVLAVITAGDVRRVLTDCSYAVVTGITCANDLGMVDRKCRCEDVGVVAILTNVGRLNMG